MEIVLGMCPLTTIEQVLRKQVNVMLIERAVALMESKSFDDVVMMAAIVNISVIFCMSANVVVTIFCHVSVYVFVICAYFYASITSCGVSMMVVGVSEGSSIDGCVHWSWSECSLLCLCLGFTV